jgi:HEAT repeat protein
MPTQQSAAFRRRLKLLVKEMPPGGRAFARSAIDVLSASRVQSLRELIDIVESEDSERGLRELSCWVVGRMRQKGWTALLGRVMSTAPDVGLAHTAVERLKDKKSSTAVKVLHQVLVRGRSPAGRAEAAWGLGYLYARSAAGSLIRVVLKQGEERAVRAEAAEALGYIRDRRAVPPLLKLLEEPDPQLRYEAIFSLGNLADRRALPALEKLLGDTTEVGKYGQLGSAAADAIRTITTLNPTRSHKATKASRAKKRAR